MLEIFRIPPPPLPSTGALLAVGGTAAAVGIALLMFGRGLWRIIAALACVGAGVAAGRLVAEQMVQPPVWGMVIGGAAGALLGFLLARLFWAVVLAGLLGAAVLPGVLYYVHPAEGVGPKGFAASELGPGAWSLQAAQTCWEWLQWLYAEQMATTVIAGALAGALGLLIGLVRPVFTRIFTTSLLGGLLAVGGACLIIRGMKTDFDFTAGYRPWILLGIGGLLWAIGMVYQYLTELKATKKEGEEEEAAPPPPKEPAPPPAKGKKASKKA